MLLTNKKKIIEFYIKFKQKLIDNLSLNFNLLLVDPVYVKHFNQNNLNMRTINFDNCLENEIYSINSNIDFDLLKYHYYLNYDTYSGIICDYFKFNRDFKKNNLSSINYNILTINYKIRIEDNNIEQITKITNQLITKINNTIAFFQTKFKSLNKLPINIKPLLVDKLKKEYPLININDALNQYIINNDACLFFDNNLFFKNDINFLFDNYSLEKFSKLFLYYNKLETIINILDVYVNPTNKQINKNIDYLPKENNILIVNINLTYLILYILKLDNVDQLFI